MIPIPEKEEKGIFGCPDMAGKPEQRPPKLWSLDVLSMMSHTEPESYWVASEESKDLIKLSTPVQQDNFPSQTTTQTWAEKKEETSSILPGTAAITDASVGGEQSCTMHGEKSREAGQVKPKGPPLAPGEKKNRTHIRKRGAPKKWKSNSILIF